MKQPKLGEFSLKRVKKIKGGGLEVQWTTTEDTGSIIFLDDHSVKRTHEPTVDLHLKINEFKEALCKVWKYESDEEKETVAVNGISISGKDGKMGVVISGVMRTATEKNIAMNTDRIVLKNNFYGFEEDMVTTIEQLTEEVYEYLYMNKYDKPVDLFSEQQEEPKTKKKSKKAAKEVEEDGEETQE
jgi:hypothetical protein